MSADLLKKIRKAKSVAELNEAIDAGNLACLVEAIRHESLGPKIHSRFLNDSRSSIRYEVASHKGASLDVLESLSNDKNHVVRIKAKERLAQAKSENKTD